MSSLAASAKPDLRIVLCSPRGFCAGVVRAIDTVERALAIYGAPVYVRHEIVHNRYVVDSLKTKGAIFVEELAEIPDNTNAPVVFSAHGVPKSVPADARARNFFSLDATCPLVTKARLFGSFGVNVLASSLVSISVTAPCGNWPSVPTTSG